MKDNSIVPFIVVGILIAILLVGILSSGGRQEQTAKDLHAAKVTAKQGKVPQEKLVGQKAEHLIEEAQEALVELKKETGVKKNTDELREVYKKLAEICSKAVKTQKNMLDAEYTTDTTDKETEVFDIENLSIDASSSPPTRLNSVTEKISPDGDDRK